MIEYSEIQQRDDNNLDLLLEAINLSFMNI